jgi:hypothetical protein
VIRQPPHEPGRSGKSETANIFIFGGAHLAVSISFSNSLTAYSSGVLVSSTSSTISAFLLRIGCLKRGEAKPLRVSHFRTRLLLRYRLRKLLVEAEADGLNGNIRDAGSLEEGSHSCVRGLNPRACSKDPPASEWRWYTPSSPIAIMRLGWKALGSQV